jgi:signal transduction histidine kinase
MAKTIPSSRPSVALATALTDKYRNDPYVRSTVHVISLQAILALVTVLIVYFGFVYQRNKVAGVRDAYATAKMVPEVVAYANETADARNQIQDNAVRGMGISILILSILFGLLTSQYALRPTRRSLGNQKRFIGNIAHELRTPLAIMKTSTEVALMESGLTPNAVATLNSTLEEITRISETINNLLSFDTLIRPGRIQTKPIHLPSTLQTVVDRHRELAKTRGINLSLDMPDAAYIVGNETAIEQVFTNLIKNALNYTPAHDNRSVTIKSWVTSSNDVLVTVADTGIGIAQKDLYYIFEPFYRGDTSRSRGIGSGTSGLGLAIVHDIVRVHQGTIVIRSALNRGTTIEISFPGADTTTYVKEFSIPDDLEQHEATITDSAHLEK